ncbi:MAG: acyltransferase [Chryseolinea sp.]
MNFSVFLYKLEYAKDKIKSRIFYRFLFNSLGRGSVISKPIILYNSEHVSVGANVLIRRGLRLEVLIRPDKRKAGIVIGNNVNIEQNLHIICQNRIVIGDRVSITGNCAIVDTTHPYLGESEKTGSVVEYNDDEVIIGSNVFIGFGTIILPGTKIGDGSYVGALSVVKGIFPNRSLIYGSPARLIKSLA